MTGREARGSRGGREPEHLSRILERVLMDAGFGRRDAVAGFVRAWREVVGAEIGNHTGIQGFRAGVLTVTVDSAPLCQELELFRKEELLGALRERVRDGYLQDLRFRLV